MQKITKILISIFISLYFLHAPAVLAAKKQAKKAVHRADQSKTLGIGGMVGTDVGVSVKYWMTQHKYPLSIHGATGYDFSDTWMILGDALYQFNNLTTLNFFSPADLHGHVGAGAKVGFDQTKVYLRIPVGVDLQYQQKPYELFLDLAPMVRLNPSVGGNFDVHIGFRYYL